MEFIAYHTLKCAIVSRVSPCILYKINNRYQVICLSAETLDFCGSVGYLHDYYYVVCTYVNGS